VNNCGRAPSKYVNKLTIGFYFRNESVLKNIFKRGYKEIRDRKLLEILKRDRTWLKYELHCNVKTLAPLFSQNNLTMIRPWVLNG
jgi:hypothetical protein